MYAIGFIKRTSGDDGLDTDVCSFIYFLNFTSVFILRR